MGGSPSKKNEIGQNDQYYIKGGQQANEAKERSVSLPTHSQQYSTMNNYQIKQIVPIKAHNRSATISYSQPHQYSITQKIPNIQNSNQKTVFTDFYDSQSASQVKSVISNLDNSMIEYQNKNPTQIKQDQIQDQQNQISSRLRVTLASNQGQIQQQQQVPYIAQTQLQRSQLATPQKQVPRIIQNSAGSIDKSSRMSPYQLLRNVVIYDNNSSFNSNNNNNSANKGITVTAKLNNQFPQAQHFSNITSNNRQMHAINASNQPKILTSYPQFCESEQQSTIRTTISQNIPIENIKVVDFLQKNKTPQNHVCLNQDNPSTVLSSQQDCSCIFSQNNHSDIQLNNIQCQKNNYYQQQLEGKQGTGNILVIDRNTARQSSAHNTSQLKDESCFNESPEQKKQNTSISLVNQQRSVDFEQKDLERADNNKQVSSDNISSAKQNSKQQNQVIQPNSTNRTQITSNQTSSTKQENASNEQTQKKKLNTNCQNENYLIQQETEKKMKEQQINQLFYSSQQKSKINLNSPPQAHKREEKSYGKNMDDQVSLMYSATEDQKKSGNSVFLLMNSGNNQQTKHNYVFISANKDQSIHNNSQTVFQNSQLCANSNKQIPQNYRSNNFLSKSNQNNERQLIVKLEDLYKQMDTQHVSQDNLLQSNQNFVDQQIRIIPHPTECNPQIQRSFSHVSSLSVFRASNEKLKEDKSCDNYTQQSEKKDLSNKSLINTSVTQLPTIQKYYYPVTSVKKVTTINKESNQLQQQIQPYLFNINQRSQSVNQSTQFTDSFYQYSSGQKQQRENYFSVDSQRNGGIFLLKGNQNFQVQNDFQQLQAKQICLNEQPSIKAFPLSNILSSNQKQLAIQEPSFLPLSQQIPNIQALQPKQQIKIDARFQVAQNQIMQQKSVQNVNLIQIQALKQVLEPIQQNGQKQNINAYGLKQIQQNSVQENKTKEIQNEDGSLINSQKDLNGQKSIIQSCELNNMQIKEQEFSKEMSNSQISQASISIIPRSIDVQDNPQFKQNNRIINDSFNQQQQPIEHLSQKKQFQTNTQKPQQKDLNHSSMDSFVATSSYANYQSSSCDEYKNIKKDCNNKTKDKEELKQNSLSNKNTVRTSDIKQEQNSSFRQQQQLQQQKQLSQPIQVSINLQEQIQNKLQREINLNSINLKQKLSPKNDKRQYSNSVQIQKEENLKQQQQAGVNHNNYSFQYNSNNFQSINNNNNTTFDFQLTRTDDEYIQNQLLTVIDEDNKQQHLLKSAPKKKLNPEDKIQIYLNFSSENSDYSSILSDCNEKLSNFTPIPAKELSFTRQLKNPLVYDKGVQVDQLNKENNLIAGMNINVSLENQVKLNQQKNNANCFQIQKQNTLPKSKQQSIKNKTQSINKNKKNPIDSANSTNEFQINKIIQNELNSATQDSYPSDQNIKVNSKMNELMLLEAQDICKKTLITYQNIIDLEDQRKSPKEFDRDYCESQNSNLNPKKRFLTQNDQEEEESLNNYREASNSMQSQSINSNNGIGGNQSTPFNFSKQQIFSSVNSYNLQNSTILRKVNNQFQALTSVSLNNNTDNEKEHLKSQIKNIIDIGDNEIFFKYCKKSGTLVPIPQSKIDEILFEKSQNVLANQYQQTQSSKKLYNNTSLNLDQPQNVCQEKRSQSNMPVGKKQNANFNNLYNNQYLFSKHNSNLYTDVLERYSGFINKKAREQKSKIQQTYQNLHNSKQSSSTNRSRQKQNLRV
ncbi:endo-1,4-beta-xylanase xylA, putative (macronuclear) [Tetrahymena thermophila SB210]|uniref:Endo-1,4-beta-xylanase xylA, putative n=1 Tax=Tetrahymena thermophila (strain SB210) TaxID=312017 RepID=I7M887_TETTS|nr:endo-1,4-beta-xylanase xylA, putative [Tetrahymena thermophila SB210]EAR97379.2 endo-1,4-beta-xylanase xylA, putative [Tetrahymena thermophila SB210]|eukprot:XP_001017624.2 endo-1,4-beta-xylanase xylA, putative [Tetrahymena thermophila SB210]